MKLYAKIASETSEEGKGSNDRLVVRLFRGNKQIGAITLLPDWTECFLEGHLLYSEKPQSKTPKGENPIVNPHFFRNYSND